MSKIIHHHRPLALQPWGLIRESRERKSPEVLIECDKRSWQ